MILSVVSWTEFEPGVSPFVAAFAKIGIPAGAGIVNFVVLTAALSSCNSGMYSTGRMLRDLALNGQGPETFGKLNKRQTPAIGITVSVLLMMIGVWVNYVDPDHAFVYITSFATVAGLWTWCMILISQIRYRAKVKKGLLPASDFRLPGAPYTAWFSLLFIAGVLVLAAIDKDSRNAIYGAPVWAAIMGVGYLVLKRRNPQAFAPVVHDWAEEPEPLDAAMVER